jgi:hypothetical protein
VSDVDPYSQGTSQESNRTKPKTSMGIKLAFIDRKRVTNGKCVFCNKKKKIFGFMKNVDNKKGLACEGCLKNFILG